VKGISIVIGNAKVSELIRVIVSIRILVPVTFNLTGIKLDLKDLYHLLQPSHFLKINCSHYRTPTNSPEKACIKKSGECLVIINALLLVFHPLILGGENPLWMPSKTNEIFETFVVKTILG